MILLLFYNPLWYSQFPCLLDKWEQKCASRQKGRQCRDALYYRAIRSYCVRQLFVASSCVDGKCCVLTWQHGWEKEAEETKGGTIQAGRHVLMIVWANFSLCSFHEVEIYWITTVNFNTLFQVVAIMSVEHPCSSRVRTQTDNFRSRYIPQLSLLQRWHSDAWSY